MVKKILYRTTQFLLVLTAAAAGLVWLPTGSWLVLPLARHLGGSGVPSLRLEDVQGSLYGGYSLTGVEVVSGDAVLLSLHRLAVRPDWPSVLNGVPWLEFLEAEGLSGDLQSLQSLAERFGGGESSSEPLRLLPMRVSVRDATVASPQGPLHLASLELSEQGHLALRSTLAGLPLDVDALVGFSPLSVFSGDLRLGEGKGSFKGRLAAPFDFRGDLAALPLKSVLPFVPGAPLRGSGRVDGRFTLTGPAEAPELRGVIALTRGVVMDVPVDLRVPWSWSGGVFAVQDAKLRSLSAEMALALSADLSGEAWRLSARGSAKDVSVGNIGRILAPQARLAGERGRLRFDLTADAAGTVAGELSVSLPEVAAAGKRVVRNLNADIRLVPGEAPQIVCDGEVFGGRVLGKGEVVRKDGALRPEMVFTATDVDTALMTAALPALSAAAPSGKLALTVWVDGALEASSTLSSSKLTVGGVTVQDLRASARYIGGQAILERLDGRIGKAPLFLSGVADVRRSTLAFEGSVQGLDPRSVPQIATRIKGTCDVRAFVGGTFSDPRVTVRVSGKDNRVAGVPLRNLGLSVTYSDDRITLPETVLPLPGGTLTLRGTVALPGGSEPRLDLSGKLTSLSLAPLAKALGLRQPLKGEVRGSFKVSGPLGTAAVSASLHGSGIRAAGVSIPKFELDARGTAREVRVDRLSATVGEGTVEGRGVVSLSAGNPMHSKTDVKLAVKGLEVRPILSPFVPDVPVGGILNGSLTLQGSPAKPSVTLRVDSPLTIRETIVDRMALSVQGRGKDRFALHASGQLGDFRLAAKGDVRREGNGWRYAMTTEPLDLDRMLSAKSPSMRGKLAGQVTVKLTGSTHSGKKGDLRPVAMHLSIPKLSASGLTVTDIFLPLQVAGGRAQLTGGRAMLYKGAVRANAEVFLADSKWQGTVSVRGLDMGEMARPFLPQGELVGSADANVRLKGNFGTLMMVFANGDFSTGKGYLHKMKVIDAVSPIKRITFETIRGTFFWDGSDLRLNPGTQATAGPRDPLYRYFSVSGPLGIPGEGLKLICKGRFDVQMLDKVLGALKGVFQYFTGGLSGGGSGLIKGAVGKLLGIEKRDFQDVSFVLAGSWSAPQLLNLRIDKPIQNYLPLDKLNKTEEQKAEDKKFRLNLKIPTGPGAKDRENRTEDQLKEQMLDNLFNIGVD